MIDGGVDFSHPDLAGGIDVARSCSFINRNTPTADPQEVANGDCSNKAAVQDLQGHGTHVATTIAARVNGIGIAGVAPEATIVALKACTVSGFCFADSVAAALRYAGDQHLDVVNLSLFADPYLYFCSNDAGQRAIIKDLQDAARYAQQQGVVIVAAAGNEAQDLGHPTTDDISPDWPPDSAVVREVRNNCRVAPAELPGVITVSASGVNTLASYSNCGHTGRCHGPGRRRRSDSRVACSVAGASWRAGRARISPDCGRLWCRQSRRGERRWAVCVDQRHIHGFAARGGCGGVDPPDLPGTAAGCGCSHAALSGDPAGLPGKLVYQRPSPV